MRLRRPCCHNVVFFSLSFLEYYLVLEIQSPEEKWKPTGPETQLTYHWIIRTSLPGMGVRRYLEYKSPSPKLCSPIDATWSRHRPSFSSLCSNLLSMIKINNCYYKPQNLEVCDAIINNWKIEQPSYWISKSFCFPSCKMKTRASDQRVIIRIHGMWK